MKTSLLSLSVVVSLFALAACNKTAVTPTVPPANAAEIEKNQEELAAARDALQRQALEIETRSALMAKQLADMEKAVKEQENAGLRGSLDDLKRQNDELQAQADEARRQSDALAQRITPPPVVNVTPTVSAPPDYSLFYEQLAPYGRWIDVTGYGYCWRPTIMTAQWRPYVDGCWTWSSLGWTWQSNEPYGWVVYHYGRWMNLARYGWIWVPGSDWAPAWVAWRQSNDYVGWAPLPPDSGPSNGVYRDCDSHYNLGPSSYVFITTNHFTQPSYTTVCAPMTRNTTIFQNSVNVTQIVRCDDHRQHNVFVHHGGPPRAQVEQACARPVRQIEVPRTAADHISRPSPGHRREEGLTRPVIVNLPAARPGAPAMRPHISDRIDRPKRVDAFEGVPQRVATEIRGEIAAESAAAVVQRRPGNIEAPHRDMRHSGGPTSHDTPEMVRPAIAVENPTLPERHRPGVLAGPNNSAPAAITPPAEQKPFATRNEPTASMPLPVVPDKSGLSEENSPATAVETTLPVATAPMHGGAGGNPITHRHQAPGSADVPAGVTESRPGRGNRPETTMSVTPTERPGEAGVLAEAEKARLQAEAQAMQQKQQAELAAQEQAMAAKMTADQAAAAEAEKVRLQAEAATMQRQQEEQVAAQQRATAEKMAAEQAAAAEAEKVRLQAEAATMQRQQEEQVAAQQRALAEKMAAEQAQAAELAERARQAEAAAMQQRQQQEEAARQAQEMAQRQAEEQARRAAEEMRAQQEAAQRAAQEMAQRQAEEAARRAAEEQMRQQQEMAQRMAEEQARRAQEMAQRQAEEQMRAQQEAAQRAAQEMAQRQAEEAARRAQEEAQRAAQEAAARAADEAARNQPQPNPPGQ